MKTCPSCKAKNQNDADFCIECGTTLKDVPAQADEWTSAAGDLLNKAKGAAATGAQKAKEAATVGAAKVKVYQADQETRQRELLKDSEKFVDQSETAVATLGNNYLQNYLLGKKVKCGAAILTQKRLYYYGKQFLGKGRTTTKDMEETVIPLEEISLTRFVHSQPIGLIVFGMLLVIGGIVLGCFLPVSDLFVPHLIGAISLIGVGAIPTIKGFAQRTTLFEVSYPGGRYFFNVKYYPIVDMRDFQRQLHLMRDNLRNG